MNVARAMDITMSNCGLDHLFWDFDIDNFPTRTSYSFVFYNIVATDYHFR
jgi:hypothetical protein